MTVFVYQSFELIREENNGLSDWEGAQFSQFSRVALQGQEHRVRQCCRSVAPSGRVLLLRECDWTRCRTPELRWKYPEKITNMSDNWLHRWLWFRGDPPWRRWCCCGWAIGGRRRRDARGGSACSDPSCSHTLKCSWRCRGEWTRTAVPNTAKRIVMYKSLPVWSIKRIDLQWSACWRPPSSELTSPYSPEPRDS